MKTSARVIGSLVAGVAVSLFVGGIAEAQDPTGIVSEAWRVGGPIAAVVTVMLLASGIAIRTLWTQLQTERRALQEALDQRTTDTAAWVREMRDCITANTAALNRLADRLDDAGRQR